MAEGKRGRVRGSSSRAVSVFSRERKSGTREGKKKEREGCIVNTRAYKHARGGVCASVCHVCAHIQRTRVREIKSV